MSGNILDNCGSYATRLQKMVNEILNLKGKNGEKVTTLDKEEIERELFEAYQNILGIATDAKSINDAINNLENIVSNSGRTDFTQIAIIAAYEAIELKPEFRPINSSEMNDYILGEKAKNDEKIEDYDFSAKAENSKDIYESIFDDEIIEGLNEKFEEAKKGDVKAAGTVVAIKQASLFMGKYPTLDEKKTRAAVAWLKRLMETNDEEAINIAEKMAKYYGFEIFETREDGTQGLSQKKLDEMYEEKIVSFKNGSKKEVDFKKVNMRAGETLIKSRNLEEYVDAREFVKSGKEDLEYFYVIQASKQMERSEKHYEGAKGIFGKYQSATKSLLDKKIMASQNINITTTQKDKLQNEILMLGEILKKIGDKNNNLSQTNSTVHAFKSQVFDEKQKYNDLKPQFPPKETPPGDDPSFEL